MKHRVMDLLRCPSCGSRKLELRGVATKEVSHSLQLLEPRCRKICAFKEVSVESGAVSASDCINCYKHEILTGVISCECDLEYSIVGGIPRMLPKELSNDIRRTQRTFSLEWKMFRFGERNWGQDMEYRKALFSQGMGVTALETKGKAILDAGCGSGMLAMEMANSFGMEVLALDLAFGIEKAYAHNGNPEIYFVQGSVLNLPVAQGAFDFLYCAGVLVACPDTRAGFTSIVPALKRGGRCFIWVYHPIDAVYHQHDRRKLLIYNWVRKNFASRLPSHLQYIFFLSLIPIFILKRSLERLFGAKRQSLTWREKMQGLTDMFSPVFQNRHTPEEVFRWFSEEGFTDCSVSDKGPYGFGVRGDRL